MEYCRLFSWKGTSLATDVPEYCPESKTMVCLHAAHQELCHIFVTSSFVLLSKHPAFDSPVSTISCVCFGNSSLPFVYAVLIILLCVNLYFRKRKKNNWWIVNGLRAENSAKDFHMPFDSSKHTTALWRSIRITLVFLFLQYKAFSFWNVQTISDLSKVSAHLQLLHPSNMYQWSGFVAGAVANTFRWQWQDNCETRCGYTPGVAILVSQKAKDWTLLHTFQLPVHAKTKWMTSPSCHWGSCLVLLYKGPW